jgi:anti-sigma B factor antagonist
VPLSLSSRHIGNVCIIECKGRIVLGEEANAMEAELVRGTREFSRVVLNVAAVERLDSTGIGLLVRYAAKAHKAGGDIRLAAAPAFFVSLLEIANLTSILQVFPTEEDAILSFLKHRPANRVERHGTRVLFFDQSPDLCAFVQAVLAQYGFEVKSTSNFGDAKILLRVEEVDAILVGPGTPQLSPETALRALRAIAPKAAALRLAPDFKAQEATAATETLLRLFAEKDVE